MINKFSKESEYFEIYQAVFNFHKKHCNASSYDEWAELAVEAGRLFNTPFKKELGLAIVNEIERQYIANSNIRSAI